MNDMRTVLSILLFSLAISPALAEEIYRTYDEEGRPVFTDQPPHEGAEPIDLRDITIAPADEPRERRPDPEPDEADDAAPYQAVDITFPPREEAVRRVTGEVPIRATLQPSGTRLLPGHRMRVFVDGTVVGTVEGLEFRTEPLNPGPRNVRVEIVDAADEVLVRSEEFHFYLLRATQ